MIQKHKKQVISKHLKTEKLDIYERRLHNLVRLLKYSTIINIFSGIVLYFQPLLY